MSSTWSSAGNRRGGRDYYSQRDRAREDERRQKEQADVKKREMNAVNFPSLGSSFANAGGSGTTWQKSGATLARAWGDADEEKKMIEKLKKEQDDRRARYDSYGMNFSVRPPGATSAPTTSNANYYDMNEYEEDDGVPSGPTNSMLSLNTRDETGWATIDSSKIKKNQTGVWKRVEPEQSDSVWGHQEEEDSVW